MLLPAYLTHIGSAYSFTNSEAEAVVDAMTTTPNDARKEWIDDFIGDLKASFWTYLDTWWVFAAHAEQAAYLNWVDPDFYTVVPTGSPTFTTDRGVKGNGSSSYCKLSYNPNSDAFTPSQYDIGMGFYVNDVSSDDARDGEVNMGANDGTNRMWTIKRAATVDADSTHSRIGTSQPADYLGSGAVTSRLGLCLVERYDSSNIRGYHQSTDLGNAAQGGTGLCDAELYLGAINSSGSPANYCDDQHGAAFVCAALGDTLASEANDILTTNMTLIGAEA